MTKRYLTLPLVALTALSSMAISEKRGVSENSFSLGCQIEALKPGVTWYYSWGNTAPKGYQNQIEEQDMEFVPMCWNGNFNAENIREYVKAHPKTKYLLGFNEPNFTAQANMTPAEAAAKWPEVQALAEELGLQLVAPALNYSPNPPYTDPTRWMDEFVALVGDDAFDFTAIHNYGGAGVMIDLATKFWQKYNKPVWVTEFCFWPGESGYVAPASQISSMVESVEWLEQTDFIYRYAWFKAIGQSSSSNSANYGLLETQIGADVSNLSEQGKVYVYMSDFDKDKYHATGDVFAATDYVARNAASLGAGYNADCPVPIEITSFISGAWLDYQFETANAGDYYIVLSVSGEGEPSRFDPRLAVYAVDESGEQGTCLMSPTTFALSGDNNTYRNIYLPVHLEAGRQRVRIADANAYAPSGIHISTVMLGDAAGVGEIDAEGMAHADVYGIDGICVRRHADVTNPLEGLPAGIYIVNGRKVMK